MSSSRQWSMIGYLMTGTLAGLVSITAGCHIMNPLFAGLIGGVAAFFALRTIDWLRRFGIDDVVSAFAVHGAGGLWGTIAVGLYADEVHFGGATRLHQTMVHSLGAFSAASFSFVTIWTTMTLMKKVFQLRVRAYEERIGLKWVEHGATNEVNELLTSMDQHGRNGGRGHRNCGTSRNATITTCRLFPRLLLFAAGQSKVGLRIA